MTRHPYPPDDPRVAEFAVELARSRGEDHAKWFGSRWRTWPWLIWSGPLPSRGDEVSALNALVQKRWWEFSGEGEVTEIEDDGWVRYVLTWLIGNTLAYEVEVMSPGRAAELAERFISLVPERRRWFGNEWDGPHEFVGPVTSSNPLTFRTFDEGVIAVADGRAWIAWFTDED